MENEHTVAGGEGIWEGQGHAAVFNMENLQGPSVQPREVCSVLCNNSGYYTTISGHQGEAWGKGQSGSLGWTWAHGCV